MDHVYRAASAIGMTTPTTSAASESAAAARPSTPKGTILFPRSLSTPNGILLHSANRSLSPSRTPQLYGPTSAASSTQSILLPSPPASPANPHEHRDTVDQPNPLALPAPRASFYNSNGVTESISEILNPPTDNAARMTPLRLLTSDSDLHDDTSGQETARPGFLAPPHCTVPLPSPSGSAKIRFAPLPEIRPRSYSTGNSLFLEDGEIDETERNWVRRETNMQTDSAIETDEELDDEDRSLGRRSSGEITRGREARIRNNASTQNSSNHIFSKDRWLMDGQVVGKSSAPTTPSGEKDGMMGAMLSSISSRGEATSITLKILRPLSFGLVKKEKKKKDSKRASSSDTGGKGDNFPRWDSMESDVSRLSSVSGISGMSGASSGRRAATAAGGGSSYGGGNGERTWGSEGGAIRRSKNDDDDGITGSGRRNWEQSAVQSGPSVNSHQYAPSRRANYPPVAQRSKKKAKPATAPTFSKVVEPKFVEWGFERAGSTGGGGMGNNRKNGINVDEDEEEDGSGLAWIKRRKEERRIKAEEAEMKKIAEEVKEAQGRLREGGESESAPPIIRLIPESPGVVEPKQGFASLQEAAHRLGTDPTANAEASTSSVSLVLSSGPPTPTSDARSERSTPSDELPDPISSHHNTSAPTSPNSLVASLPLLTTTPVVIPPVPSRSIAPHIRKHSTSPDGRKESEESEEADDVDAASDDEEEESSGEESDLDEDELAIEEEMKEKARITALSAATEKYSNRGHSHVVKSV